MSLRSLVKISAVNNLSVARYVAGMGVELLGFDLESTSDKYVDPDKFAAITSWVSGVKFVGEITAKNQRSVPKILDQYQLDYLQITVSQPINLVENLPLPLLVKINQTDETHISDCLEQYSSIADWFLIEPDEPMSEAQLDWCTRRALEFPLILGSNISTHNVHHLIESGFAGIALEGGNEIKPGMGNFDELADLLEALEVVD